MLASEPVDAVRSSVDDNVHDAVENMSEENAPAQPDIDDVEESPERRASAPDRRTTLYESAALVETPTVEDSPATDVEDGNQEQLSALVSQDIELSDFSPSTPLRLRKRAGSDRSLQRDAANPACSATDPAVEGAQQCLAM